MLITTSRFHRTFEALLKFRLLISPGSRYRWGPRRLGRSQTYWVDEVNDVLANMRPIHDSLKHVRFPLEQGIEEKRWEASDVH